LNEEAREYNSAIAALMQERHSQSEPVTWIDMYNDSGVTVQDLGDGIHPDDQGYDKMGRLWFTDMMNSQ
jgi:acyl-CoA thioesterase-1